jgi:hypothetical protein
MTLKPSNNKLIIEHMTNWKLVMSVRHSNISLMFSFGEIPQSMNVYLFALFGSVRLS